MTTAEFKTAFNDAAATAKVMTAAADKAYFETKSISHDAWELMNKKAAAYFEARVAFLENITA